MEWEETVLGSLADKKHAEKSRVELGLPGEKNTSLEKSMAKAAILVPEDKGLAGRQGRACKAAGRACWQEC